MSYYDLAGEVRYGMGGRMGSGEVRLGQAGLVGLGKFWQVGRGQVRSG
jgi:hypothetical protein